MMIGDVFRLSIETIQKQENLKMRKIYTIMLVALVAVMLAACAAPVDTSEADAAAAELEAQVANLQAQLEDAAEADAAAAELEGQVAELQAQLEDASGNDAVAADLEAQLAAAQEELTVAEAAALEAAAMAEEAAMMPAERADGLPVYTGGPAEIRMGWWGNDDRAARTLQVIELFEAAYPEITVIGEPNGGAGDHFQILDTQLAASDASDLIQFGGNWPDYVQYLEPINDYLGNQLLIDTPETFDQTAFLPATTADGDIVAVSLGTNTLVLVYNKSMIEAAGVDLPADNMSWDELIAYGQELKAALPDGVAPFVDNGMNQANYLSYFYRQEDTPLWTSDEGGTSYATVESAQKWIQMWADMRAEGLIPDADTTYTYTEDGPDSSALVAGDAAMGLIWSNQGASYQAAMTDEIGMTTLPVGGEDSYVIQMSQYLAVNEASENKEAAMLFVNFFVSTPTAGAVLQTNRGIPSSPVVRQGTAVGASKTDAEVYRIYDAVADRTIPQDPNLPNDQEFVNELELIGQQVAYEQSSVEEAAEALQALIERLAVK